MIIQKLQRMIQKWWSDYPVALKLNRWPVGDYLKTKQERLKEFTKDIW